MSDILDHKSDAEIEEIYGRASMEDLQNMLNQEKCLNRRRLLRKVMRIKSSNYSDNSIPLENRNPEYIENSTKERPLTGFTKTSIVNELKSEPVTVENTSILEKLNQLRKQLHGTVDLAERKELRKEIQELENKCSAQQKISDDNSRNPSYDRSIPTKGSDKCKNFSIIENKNNIKEEPKLLSSIESKEGSNLVNKPKSNLIRSADITKSDTKASPSQDSLKENNQKIQHSSQGISLKETSNTLNKTLSIQDSLNKNQIKSSGDAINKQINNSGLLKSETLLQETHKMGPSSRETLDASNQEYLHQPVLNIINKNQTSFSQKDVLNKTVLSDNQKSISSKPVSLSDIKTRTVSPAVNSSQKPTSNIFKTDLPTTPTKPNVSRVSSVREKFENSLNANIFPKKTTNSVKMSDKEINDLVNTILKPDKEMPKSSLENSDDHILKVPNSQTRKVSQQNILLMIPQMKKKAKTARSTVQAMKEQLIIFCQQNTQEYQNVRITNYSKSWADGLAFCALIHHFYPDSFDYNALSSKNSLLNFKLAFDTAKKYAGIEPLIDPEDMIALDSPDEKCVYTYVQFMYSALKVHPRNVLKRVENPES